MTTTNVYGRAVGHLLNGEILWGTDDIRVCLLTSSYGFNSADHETYEDVSAFELTGMTGYTAGGALLANCTSSLNTLTNTTTYDANDAAWTSATLSGVRHAVIYKDSGDPVDSWLICCIRFTNDESVTGATATVSFSSAGIFTVTAY